jgi:archaellum component FlaC
MSTIFSPQDEIDKLQDRISDLESTIQNLERTVCTVESENNSLKSEIEEIKEKNDEKVGSLIDEINEKVSEGFDIFYELYAVPIIEKLEKKEISALDAFEDIVNHHIFCDMIAESMETCLGFFHEDEDESILKNTYSLSCNGIERLLKDINSVVDEDQYNEFIKELCRGVYLCPTNILAILNEYTQNHITYEYVQSLPLKTKNALARSLMHNFYVSNSFIPSTMMNSIASYSLGLQYTSAMKELFVCLWDHLHQDKLKVKMRDHDAVGNKINAVVNYKRGLKGRSGDTVCLLEYLLVQNKEISEDFWNTFITKNQEAFKKFYHTLSKRKDGTDHIKKIPSSTRKEINKLKMKGEF